MLKQRHNLQTNKCTVGLLRRFVADDNRATKGIFTSFWRSLPSQRSNPKKHPTSHKPCVCTGGSSCSHRKHRFASATSTAVGQTKFAIAASPDAPLSAQALAGLQKDDIAKRFLGTRGTDNESDDDFFENGEEEAEREMPFWLMLRNGMGPKKLRVTWGIEGLGQDAYKHPKYEKYLAFAK